MASNLKVPDLMILPFEEVYGKHIINKVALYRTSQIDEDSVLRTLKLGVFDNRIVVIDDNQLQTIILPLMNEIQELINFIRAKEGKEIFNNE